VEKLRRNGGSGLKSMQDLAGIRYGEPPMKWWEPGDVDSVHEAYFTAQYDLRTYTVKWALKVAELISLVEIGEVTALEGSALRSYRRDVNDSLAELRRALRDIDDVDEVASRSRG
jgi:hypothetical protein